MKSVPSMKPAPGFLQEFFSGEGAKSIVVQISIVMLIFLLFSHQLLELRGAKVSEGVLPVEEGQGTNTWLAAKRPAIRSTCNNDMVF